MLSTTEIEPAERPDERHLRDALHKGQGRALTWARAGVWTQRQVLLEACLEDHRHDWQIDTPRGPWLWEIMEAVGAIDEFREPILAATGTIEEDVAAVQLCEFCVYYARRGDDRFRQRLRQIVADKPVPFCPWMGEEELIDLEPDVGLLLIARLRGAELLAREWEWEDVCRVSSAVEKFGFGAVAALLDREAKTSADVGRFRDAWHKDADARNARVSNPRQSHEERMRSASLADVLRDAETGGRAGLLRGWGMYASESDLQTILDRLLSGAAPAVLANYLWVFSKRPMPQFDQRLLGLLEHEDDEVRRRAFTAVSQNAHPQIRQFALTHADRRINEPNFLELFIKNFRSGDEALLMRHLSLPDDENDCHSLLMDLKFVLRENPEADCRKLALVSYGANPCASCRHDAAKLLITRGGAAPWLVEECRFDAEPDTRKLVLKPS